MFFRGVETTNQNHILVPTHLLVPFYVILFHHFVISTLPQWICLHQMFYSHPLKHHFSAAATKLLFSAISSCPDVSPISRMFEWKLVMKFRFQNRQWIMPYPNDQIQYQPFQEAIDWRYPPYIRPMFKAYVREYPWKYGLIWYSSSILGSWNSHWQHISPGICFGGMVTNMFGEQNCFSITSTSYNAISALNLVSPSIPRS